MTPVRFFSLLLGISAVLCGCRGPSGNSASELMGSVTQVLRERGVLLCDNPLPAEGEPFSFDVARCAGRHAYLETAILPGGINDVMDADGERRITIVDVETLKAADEDFAPKVKRRVLQLFKGDEQQQTLHELIGRISGRETTTLGMPGVIASELAQGAYRLAMIVPRAAVRIAPYVSIASHGGSYIHLTEDTHFINVGYRTGGNVERDIRTGRSFGVTRTRPALDASDVDYLDGIETILQGPEAAPYQRALMRFLTASDPRGISELSDPAQIIAVDFTAVYTAELDRHLMVDLDPNRHAWQRDLAEATWLSSYVASSKKLFRDGRFGNGRPRDFFKQGTSGGGIGKTLRDRRRLAKAISAFMWAREDVGAIARLAALVGAKSGDDVFHALGLMLISKDRTGHVIAQADAITEATTAFLTDVAANAAGITAFIESAPARE